MDKTIKFFIVFVLLIQLSHVTFSYVVPGCKNHFDPWTLCLLGECNQLFQCSEGTPATNYNSNGNLECHCERRYTSEELKKGENAKCETYLENCKISSSYEHSCALLEKHCSKDRIKSLCKSGELPEYGRFICFTGFLPF